jgi:hypothetical protein
VLSAQGLAVDLMAFMIWFQFHLYVHILVVETFDWRPEGSKVHLL